MSYTKSFQSESKTISSHQNFFFNRRAFLALFLASFWLIFRLAAAWGLRRRFCFLASERSARFRLRSSWVSTSTWWKVASSARALTNSITSVLWARSSALPFRLEISRCSGVKLLEDEV